MLLSMLLSMLLFLSIPLSKYAKYALSNTLGAPIRNTLGALRNSLGILCVPREQGTWPRERHHCLQWQYNVYPCIPAML